MESTKQISRTRSFFSQVIAERLGQFSLLIFFRIIGAVIPLIITWYYSILVEKISDTVISKQLILSQVWQILIIIALLYVVELIVRRLIEYIITVMETATMKSLYDKCFDYLHKHSYQFFANNFAGSLVKKVNKLVSAYETIVDTIYFDLIQIIVMTVSLIGIMMFHYRLLGIIFLGRIIIYGISQYFFYNRTLPYANASQEQDSIVTGVLSDTITNHNNITTFASLGFENRKFQQETQLRKNLTKRSRFQKNIIYAVNALLINAMEIGAMYIIIHMRFDGIIGVGVVVAFQMYLFQLFEKLFFIGQTFKRIFGAISESTEMIQILDMPHEIQDISSAPNLIISKGHIELDAITFSYNENILLEDFNLNIAPGEKIGLVGPSGAGKSTIIKLLFRLYDIQKGNILIDNQNISEVSQDSLRSQISLVPQDPILFHRSLLDNIKYGKPEATMEEVIKASKMARCHDFISALPDQYDTFVGERGIKLSGGERQRVAIARAILEDKKILVMDEATSSLDSESEKLIQQAIHELIQHKTALIIAHRLSTIKEMDRIVVMQDGKIVEEGNHQELLDTDKGLYNKLWQIQVS